MGTTTAICLTKPRISALILEATAATVSIVLVVWLLLWFGRKSDPDQVDAYYVAASDVGVAPEEVPFQAADVRSFLGGSVPAKATRPNDLVPAIRHKIRISGRPLVVYVSVPVVGTSSGRTIRDTVKELITCVTSDANRDVLLALDVAQIDTDRDLGVYGNSPYALIEENIPALEKAKRKIFVLAAAGPAQKSWPADELRQSVFGYYLRKGLEGDAKGRREKHVTSITIEELARYVNGHVRDWVRRNRNESVQAPRLLPFSSGTKDPSTVILRTIRSAGAAPASRNEAVAGVGPRDDASAQTKTEPKTQPETVVSAGAAPNAAVGLFDQLGQQWQIHDALKAHKPYRHLPGSWRSYQAHLLRAERQVRAAWLDPDDSGAVERAKDGLGSVREEYEALKRKLDERTNFAQSFPIRSVMNESSGEGKKQLYEALNYLAGASLDAPEFLPPAGAIEAKRAQPDEPSSPSAPGIASSKPAPAAGQPPASERSLIPPHVPSGLLQSTPNTYVELQLPAWAYKFAGIFQSPEYFKKDLSRRQTLLALVESRTDAERALDLDLRGLGWVKDLIANGDGIRRIVQDELLSGKKGDVVDRSWKDDVEHVRATYKSARARAEAFQQARETWEEAAAELPTLVEWAVRQASYGARMSQELPESVSDAVEALEAFQRLSVRLGTEPTRVIAGSGERTSEPLEDLNAAGKDARTKLDGLHRRFRGAIGPLPLENRDWTALDAALRTPLIEWKQRRALLDTLRAFDEPPVELPVESSSASDGDPVEAADRGFSLRAAGLAQLDLSLSRIAGVRGSAADEASGVHELESAWTQSLADAKRDLGAREGNASVPDFTAAVHKAQVELKDMGDAAGRKLTAPGDLARKLIEQDRRARLLDGWQFIPVGAQKIDEAAERYRQFARYAVLDFHLHRLREDYADKPALQKLVIEIQKLAISVQSDLSPITDHSLEVVVDPPGPLRMEKWKGKLRVGLARPKEQDVWSPSGKAFIGVVVPKGLRIDNVESDMDIPGQLVGVGGPDSVLFNSGDKEYPLVQYDYEAPSLEDVEAVAFYRGRADEESRRRIKVKANPPTDLVTVRIRQNKKSWEAKYPGAPGEWFVDQFLSHQTEGFMHLGGSLDYVITIENQIPARQEVRCLIQSFDPGSQQRDKDMITLRDVTQQLGPNGTLAATFDAHAATVRLNNGAANEKRTLRITVTPPTKNGLASGAEQKLLRAPLEINFSQKTIDDYMKVVARHEFNCQDPRHERANECYIVTYTRLESDRFTEPIRADQWQCTIRGQSKPPADGYIMPGDGIAFHHHYNERNADWLSFKWSGQIENESIEGVGPERPKQQKKAP
jgi:hypothetical protein